MAITSIKRDLLGDPHLVRIEDSANLAAITAANYWTSQESNVDALNNGAFSFKDGELVMINYSDGEGLFKFDNANATFVSEKASAYHVPLAGKHNDGGGSATITIPATGVLATDIAFAQLEASTNGVSIQKVTPSANTVTVVLNADPGASTVVSWQVVRASA